MKEKYNVQKHLPESVLESGLCVEKKSKLVFRKLGFDLGIFDPDTQNVYILNATAAVIWENITENRSYWDISSGVALSYGLEIDDAKKIASDVHSVVARWKRDGLFDNETKYTESRKRPEIPFPEREVSRITASYLRPNYSKFTVGELKERYKLEEYPIATPFADVWI